MPLVAGDEISVGREETALISPLVSSHPAELERAYVTSCWRSKALHEAALNAWPGIVVWAAGYRSGETNGDSHLDQVPAVEAAPADRPLAPGVKRVRRGVVAPSDLL